MAQYHDEHENELVSRPMTSQPDTEQRTAVTLSEAMKLWREHGGDSFGPRVEHVSMKQSDFLGFCNALLASPATGAGDPSAWDISDDAGVFGTTHLRHVADDYASKGYVVTALYREPRHAA